MGFKFRKGRNARVSVSKSGASFGVSIPGTGISWNSRRGSKGGGAGCCCTAFVLFLGISILGILQPRAPDPAGDTQPQAGRDAPASVSGYADVSIGDKSPQSPGWHQINGPPAFFGSHPTVAKLRVQSGMVKEIRLEFSSQQDGLEVMKNLQTLLGPGKKMPEKRTFRWMGAPTVDLRLNADGTSEVIIY